MKDYSWIGTIKSYEYNFCLNECAVLKTLIIYNEENTNNITHRI